MADGNIPFIDADEEFTPNYPNVEALAKRIVSVFLIFNTHYNPTSKAEIDEKFLTLTTNHPEIRDLMGELFEDELFEDNENILDYAKDISLIHMHRKLMADAEIDYKDMDNGEIDLDAGRRAPIVRCVAVKFDLFVEYVNYRIGNQHEENPPLLKEYMPKLYKRVYKACVKPNEQAGGSKARRIGYIRRRW